MKTPLWGESQNPCKAHEKTHRRPFHNQERNLQLNINGFYYRCIELFPLIKSPTPPEEDLSSSKRYAPCLYGINKGDCSTKKVVKTGFCLPIADDSFWSNISGNFSKEKNLEQDISLYKVTRLTYESIKVGKCRLRNRKNF